MTYKEATDWLFNQLPMFSRVGAPAYKPGLDTSYRLDEFFNHPHLKFKSIHVAGTNGKGSTSHMLASILQAAGYKTGLYTSPHLVDFRERMRINGQMIPQEKVIEFVENWKESGYDGKPSFFELTMMMAFDWFAKEKVDYAVIEVGMGGRLDSTNIITPELCVITNISKDHTQFLGNTLPEIATEKAGIIKKNIPVVIGERCSEDIAKVFQETARELEAPLTFAEDRLNEISFKRAYNRGRLIEWKGKTLFSPLSGDYQQKNILTILTAAEGLKDLGVNISEENISQGLETVCESTGLMGRWTILKTTPLIIADTGHNIAGLSYNLNQLTDIKEERSDSTLRIVIGFVADKAIDDIINILPKDAVYYITNAKIPRALPAQELKKKFDIACLKGEVFSDVKKAYSKALNNASPNDIIYVGGSTFIVADLLQT